MERPPEFQVYEIQHRKPHSIQWLKTSMRVGISILTPTCNVTQVGKKNELLQDSFFREVQFSLRKRM
jgi:hypothetical protein